jgi:hypothetical protein
MSNSQDDDSSLQLLRVKSSPLEGIVKTGLYNHEDEMHLPVVGFVAIMIKCGSIDIGMEFQVLALLPPFQAERTHRQCRDLSTAGYLKITTGSASGPVIWKNNKYTCNENI